MSFLEKPVSKATLLSRLDMFLRWTLTLFPWFDLARIRNATGAAVVSLARNRVYAKEFRALVRAFRARANKRRAGLRALRKAVREVYASSTSSPEAIARAYDLEYAGDETHYAYTGPLLARAGFTLVTGYAGDEARTLRIIDVGAGSNDFLRFCRDELHVPPKQCVGADVSRESVAHIIRDGFVGYCGRLETVSLPAASFDLVCLSYFIDYDTDQRATFEAAVRLTKPGGKIVLEGWFPVRPFAFLDTDRYAYIFVTKGRSVVEDVALVARAFAECAYRSGRSAKLVQVSKGMRHVYSRYGLRALPSYFLTVVVS